MIPVTVRIDDGLDGIILKRSYVSEFFQRPGRTVRYHACVDENDTVPAHDHAHIGNIFGYAQPCMFAELHHMGNKLVASFFKGESSGAFVHGKSPEL